MSSGGSSGGKFFCQKYVSSTTIGHDRRPVKESYQTKSSWCLWRRQKTWDCWEKTNVSTYRNWAGESFTWKNVSRKGRKVVYENEWSLGSQNSNYYYKGISDTDEYAFDNEWEGAAIRLGLDSDFKSLPYGSWAIKPYKYK